MVPSPPVPVAPIAVLPARLGALAPGGVEVAAEAAGRTVLIGSDLAPAVAELAGVVAEVEVAEVGEYAAGAWAVALAGVVGSAPFVLLPASPGGRDLAPRLAAELGWPLVAGAIEVTRSRVVATSGGGLLREVRVPEGPFVATLIPGVRGAAAPSGAGLPRIVTLHLEPPERHDAEVMEVLPADAATMDLAESTRIVGGGAGLMAGDPAAVGARFERLRAVGVAIGASMGATRVVTDAGWVGHERQIGTTGVVVDPRLYLAFGISGAVQHTAGLGHPSHVISVNTDRHCPMMAMGDLAVVADANGVLDALHDRLVARGDGGPAASAVSAAVEAST